MESHIRVYISANWEALGALSCSHYKVLIALVQRADPFGRCFPSVERIAEDTDLHVRTVYMALETLEACRYVGYLRRNECDPITGRFVPNVYLVSPYFICIAEDNQVEAIALWKSIFDDIPQPRPFESKVHINQHQEPPTKNLYQRTSKNNHHHQPTFADENEGIANNASDLQKTKKATANRKTASQPDNDNAANKQREAPQRSQDGESSAIVKKYTNPDPMPAPLPDGLQETLAERVNEYGIHMPLARGFILEYGFEPVKVACNQLDAVAERQGISNPGGFFRYLIQQGVLDKNIPDILREAEESDGVKRYAFGKWAKFFNEGENYETE